MYDDDIGECFRQNEVWTSPRGKKYEVVFVMDGKATLKDRNGKNIKRGWSDVIAWVRFPEDNQ